MLNVVKLNRERALSRQRLLIALALGTVYLVWGSGYLVLEIALRSFPPVLLTGIRFAVAGALLLALAHVRGQAMPTPRQWLHSFVLGTGMLSATYALGTVAQQYVSSSLAAVLYATEPLWMLVFSMFIGHKTTRFEWIGLGLGLMGIVLLNLDGELNAQPIGVALLLISAANWSFWSVFGKRLDQPKGMSGYGAQMLSGSVAMFVASFVIGEPLPQHVSADGWLALVYLTLFGAMAANSAYLYLAQHSRPTVAVSYAYVNPVVAVALGAMFAGDAITPLSLASLALILGSVVFMVVDGKTMAKLLARLSVEGMIERATAFALCCLRPQAHFAFTRTFARTFARAQLDFVLTRLKR